MDEDEAKFNLNEIYPDKERISELYTEDELDVEKQIDALEQLVSRSDSQVLIEKIGLGAILSGFISSVPVPDDGVGIPPRLAEYFLGKIVSNDTYGSEEPEYFEIARTAVAVQDAYCYSILGEIDPQEAKDDERVRHSTEFNLRLREVTAGRFMFWEQPIEVAERAYTPHNKKLRELLGFDINQAISFTKYIEGIFDKYTRAVFDKGGLDIDEVMSDQDSMESLFEQIKEEDQIPKTHEREDFQRDAQALEESYQKISSYTSALWIPENKLLEHLPDGWSSDAFRAFLTRMSVDLDPFNSNFRYIDDHNPMHGSPIVKKGDIYFVPHPRLPRQALMETYYYDLISAEDYGEPDGEHGGNFGKIWGNYIEDWTYDSLTKLFPESDVFLNPTYADSGKEAADVIVWDGKYLVVFECKSKKLVLETRSGDFETAKEDLEGGIGDATQQATELMNRLDEQGELKLNSDDGKITISESDVKFKYPVVVLGDQYDSLGIRLFDEILELERTPFVVSATDLQIITEALDHPIRFIGYVSQRISITSNELVFGQDEVDMLGLFIDRDHEFPNLSEDQFLQLGDYSHIIGQKLGYKFGP